MAGWMEKLSIGKDKSASQAKERLKLVLIHDRTDLSDETINSIKNELLEVISRYVDIDVSSVKVLMTNEGREQRLVADIPIKITYQRRIR